MTRDLFGIFSHHFSPRVGCFEIYSSTTAMLFCVIDSTRLVCAFIYLREKGNVHKKQCNRPKEHVNFYKLYPGSVAQWTSNPPREQTTRDRIPPG
jgi:hypothetical protein